MENALGFRVFFVSDKVVLASAVIGMEGQAGFFTIFAIEIERFNGTGVIRCGESFAQVSAQENTDRVARALRVFVDDEKPPLVLAVAVQFNPLRMRIADGHFHVRLDDSRCHISFCASCLGIG